MTVALILGLLILAVIFGWAAGKVRSLAMAVVLQMGCFIFLALAVIVAGAAITGTGGMVDLTIGTQIMLAAIKRDLRRRVLV